MPLSTQVDACFQSAEDPRAVVVAVTKKEQIEHPPFCELASNTSRSTQSPSPTVKGRHAAQGSPDFAACATLLSPVGGWGARKVTVTESDCDDIARAVDCEFPCSVLRTGAS